MDAIRAEVQEWASRVDVAPSDEVMKQFYVDSLEGGTPDELAEQSVTAAVLALGTRVIPRDQMLDHMAFWCSGVLVGVRAAKRMEEAESRG